MLVLTTNYQNKLGRGGGGGGDARRGRCSSNECGPDNGANILRGLLISFLHSGKDAKLKRRG